jgi:CHRD domain
VRRIVVVVTIVLVGTAGALLGQAVRDWRARLSGYNEVPAISTPGRGSFTARIRGEKVNWALRYRSLAGTVTQGHIHFGDEHTNGAIVVFLCTNAGNAPAEVPTPQPCPQSSPDEAGVVLRGTFTAADVIARPAQGIAANDFRAVIRAIRNNRAYANVHSSPNFTSGEIRGRLIPLVVEDDEDADEDDE